MFEFTIREFITPFTPFHKTVRIIHDSYNNLYSRIRQIMFFIDTRVSVRVSIGCQFVGE